MAFRNIAMRVGAGAGGATAASPGAAHCYSRPAARPGQNARAEETWILPQMIDNDQILFSEEEVSSTVSLFLGLPGGLKPTSTVITEVDGGSDDGSLGTSANLQMEEADRGLVSNQVLQQDFSRTLSSLLNNREVQSACVNALRDDPAFGDLMAQLPGADALPGNQLELASLLPPAAQAADAQEEAEGSSEDPMKDFLDALGARAKGVGERIKSTWDSVGNSVGQAIIRVGFAIHSLLGRPFQQEPAYAEQAEWVEVPQGGNPWLDKSDAVGKVVIKVACVIVALMVFKRVYRP